MKYNPYEAGRQGYQWRLSDQANVAHLSADGTGPRRAGAAEAY